MKIGVDLRVLTRGARTGVEQYTIGLLEALGRRDKKNEYRFFYNAFRKVSPNFSWTKGPRRKLFESRIPNRLLFFLTAFFGRPFLDQKLGGVDVYFAPHFFRTAVKDAKLVLTFHDLSFEYYPEFFPFRKRLWHSLMNPRGMAQKADLILAVSKSTKEDLVNLYRIDQAKIKVVYPGIEEDLFCSGFAPGELEAVRRKYHLPEKFILFFGTIEPRKNLRGLIEAFEILKRQDGFDDFHLILAGSLGWLYRPILARAKRSSFASRIHFPGFIENKDKRALYSLAKLFVYPAFFEGFGFPPLEAMACGIPVVCSNKSSLPEVVGEAAMMIDPYLTGELAETMKLVLKNEKFKNELVAKGFSRAKGFSWDKTAEQFLEILSESTYKIS